MATYSQDISVTWNGTPFEEVQGLSWSYGGGRQGRDTYWTGDQGSVSVECLGSANTNISNYGKRYLLEIAGGGASLSTYAMWETVGVGYERNGVTRYTVTFRVLDN